MTETIRIAELASLVSTDLFEWFKWSFSTENDLNHNCCMPIEHFKNASEDSDRTHPTDVVFYYQDPYLNKKIYFNTDLKSYAKESISKGEIQKWLTSLTLGTICARSSQGWRDQYQVDGSYEIRGLLFVYNHDGLFKKAFYEFFSFADQPAPPLNPNQKRRPSPIHIKDLNIPKGVKIHMIDPLLIDYMLSIKHDWTDLMGLGRVPHRNKLFFFYPQQKMFRPAIANKDCPATLELISGPFLIIGFDEFHSHEDNTEISSGFVVYYREKGNSVEEFVFLLDTLSSFQLIDERFSIEIRHAPDSTSSTSAQNFQQAQKKYCDTWGLNSDMANLVNNIKFGKVTMVQKVFCDKKIDREPIQK